MIDRGALGHAVNADVAVADDAPPLPSAVERNLARWGGDVALARTLRAGVGAVAPSHEATITALIAWRAGAVPVREDALARTAAMLQADTSAVSLVHRAMRWQADVDVSSAVAALIANPFAWPGQQRKVVAHIGGFVGLQGPFLAPPDRVVGLDRADRFAVGTAAGWFAATVDVCGHRFSPLPAPVQGVEQTRIQVGPSYLLTVLADTA